MPLTIAMDGPVGAGKSTVADEVARRLGILHLDTGAMYRAIGYGCLRDGVDVADEDATEAYCHRVQIDVAYSERGQITCLNGEDVTAYLRSEPVSMAASTVAKYAGVRKCMVALQQKLASQTDMLVDGRDICLRVLPNATVKVFLTASAEERAERRWKQLRLKGIDADYQQVLDDLKKRDEQDMNREVDPLRPTDDATVVDTTGRTFEDSVKMILKLVEEKQSK